MTLLATEGKLALCLNAGPAKAAPASYMQTRYQTAGVCLTYACTAFEGREANGRAAIIAMMVLATRGRGGGSTT